jgi:hypothetical protein
MMLALDLGERVAKRAKEIIVGVMMVPSRLNSITACARAIAAILPASSMLRILRSVMSVANLTTLAGLLALSRIGL